MTRRCDREWLSTTGGVRLSTFDEQGIALPIQARMPLDSLVIMIDSYLKKLTVIPTP